MKKGVCILLAIILLLASVGCAGEGEVTASSQAGSAASSGSATASLPGGASSEGAASEGAPLISEAAVITASGTMTFDLAKMADAKRVLANPDKGWYLHYYDDFNGRNYGNYASAATVLRYMPYLDHIYLRLPWSVLEPEEGKFNWDVIDKVANDFTAKGVGVAFRITCKEEGSYCPYATPEWVKKAGAAGKMIDDSKDGKHYESWEPDYGDAIFLAKLDNFHKAFAARYAGKDYVRYIDVGSYGTYGEGHNINSSNKTWPWDVIKQHFDIYAKYYPNDLVTVSDDFVGGGYVRSAGANGQKIRDYVLAHGWSWRDDSINGVSTVKSYADTDSVRSPFLFEEVWQTGDVVLELEHYSWVIAESPKDNKVNLWNNGSILKAASKRTHAAYAGWHGFIEDFMVDGNIAYAEEMNNLLGYWFFLDKMDVAYTGSRWTCRFSWRNEGFANAHKTYDLDLILTDAKGRDAVFNFKDFDCTKIMPGESLTTTNTVDLGDLASGEYTLSIRMHKGDTPVLLALNQAAQGKDGRYSITKVTL